MSNTKKKNTKEPKRKKRLVKLIWLMFVGPFIALGITLFIVSLTSLPSLEELENPKSNLATQIFTADGEVIGNYFRENRTNVEYYQLPENIINALVATEDERFYDHAGVDAEALARALARMGAGGGGSTLTQQLAKMQFHKSPGSLIKRIFQKFGEWIIATRIEKRYTKEEIIAMYLNQFDFLNNAVGIHSASSVYFNKSPKDLDLHEAAMLVGMAKNPSLFNPLRRPDTVLHRRMVVLSQMKKNGFITSQEYDSIRKLPLGLKYTRVDHKSGVAPYFREMLRSEVSDILEMKNEDGEYICYNKKEDRPYDLYADGLRIHTTLDSRMQKYAEWAVEEHLGKELQKDLDRFIDAKNGRYTKRPPFSNRIKEEAVESILNQAKKQTMLYKKLMGSICTVCERSGTTVKTIDGTKSYVCNYNAKHIEPVRSKEEVDKIFNTPEPTQVFDWGSENYEKDTVLSPMDAIKYHKRFLRSSLMSMDPRTGHIKAWVGGPNFKYFQYDMVKKGKRQVGSTFKPFVYATAIQEGVIAPCDEIPNIQYCVDVPKGNRTDQWCPKNAGIKMNGQDVSFKFALAASMNNITAYVIKKIMPQNVIDNVEKAGVPKGTMEPYPSLALGVFDISLYHMVGGINVFANNGIYVEPVFITRIEDKNGNLIYEYEPKTAQVFDPATAYTTVKMMKGVVDGVPHPTMKTDGGNTLVAGTSRRLRSGKDYRPYGGLKMPIAGKTGTTNDNTDGWFLGLTPDLVTGVWTGCEDQAVRFDGYNKGSDTYYGQGANMALPIWGYYMNKVYEDKELDISIGDFKAPDNYVNLFDNCKDIQNIGIEDPNDLLRSGLEF